MSACKICGNTDGNRLHVAKELAFGIGGEFRYLECGRCGCVQLLDVPQDMAKFYPGGYYSLQPQGKLKTFIRHRWSKHAWGQWNPIGWLISTFYGPRISIQAVKRAEPEKSARILDVGCGMGTLLLDLAWLGYQNLAGADPYLPHDISHPEGVRIYKRELGAVEGRFDLIMMNHSFEHMEQPGNVLKQVADKLTAKGKAIVAIPVASSFAWRNFGVNWGHLDAPRHLFLHTSKSIEILTAQAGLSIEQAVQESNDGQFWMAEQYSQGIPLHDPRSLSTNMVHRLKKWRYISECRRCASEINERNEGDMVCFHLRKG